MLHFNQDTHTHSGIQGRLMGVLCHNRIYSVFLNFCVSVFFLNTVKMFHNSSFRFILKFSGLKMPLHYQTAINKCHHSYIFLSLSINLSEFSVLVDVLNAERCCVNPVDDYILSLYHFNISSPNNQPVDKGKCLGEHKMIFSNVILCGLFMDKE